MIALLLVVLILSPMIARAEAVSEPRSSQPQQVRTGPLTIEEVLARIELTHPLLQATGVERMKARAKILKALGAWEPTLKNITEVERYETWNLTTSPFLPNIQTGGFNDTKLEIGHPWGFRIHGGIRNGLGDRINQSVIAIIPDLQLFYPQQQIILGGSFQLLRGLIINEENAEFQQAELAGPLAEVKVAQKRQDLYLAGAIQYWDWQVAVKQAEVQRQALRVAEERYAQIEGQAKAGKVSPLDVVEQGQEVQRRKQAAIAAQRKVELEQYKLSLFLWENGEPVTPRPEWAPEFQGETPLPTEEEIAAYKAQAKEDRPEVRALYIEAKMKDIDLKLAKNKLLPKLILEGGPTEGATDWIVGVGYRTGLHFEMPLFQREGRGKVMAAEVGLSQLALKQQYTEQQVTYDVDNWISAIVRARDRVRAATESYRLAKELEAGEIKRFDLGLSSILFVNLRQRNVVDTAYQLYRAQADYAVARGGLLWAIGALSKPVADAVMAKYGNPLTAAGINGYKQAGRD
ncbi:MAG: TolC family protein [Nitrospira sp.]|nr:TolC family protein [Nitrospira sp.]MCP9464385.1 TolC family protein [Nitrospira sp.]